MLIKKEDSKKKEISEFLTVWEFDFPSKELGFATAKIDGRFPEKKKVINKECNEIYFVISGKGIIHHESGDFEVKEGDAFFFEKGKPYWIEGEDLVIAIPTAPAWFPEQHEYVD